jgi:GAF domain-containing protein
MKTLAQTNWAEKLEHLHQIAILVAGSQDLDTALQTIVDSARELANAELAALGVPGKPGQPMDYFYVAGLSNSHSMPSMHPPIGRGILSLLLHDGKSIRMPNVRMHPAFKGYPDAHPMLEAFLGVPVQSGGEVIGDLYIANKLDGDEFSEDDQQLIEMLAAHAAVVIQSLHYHEQTRSLALLKQREQLARELQDDILQIMYGVGLLIEGVKMQASEQEAREVTDLKTLLDDAIERLRRHLLGLAPLDKE